MEESGNNGLESGEMHHNTHPKDFVCPITCNIFYDPVTIETGQTYERSAIQEWLDRGNSTCPITGQKLQNTQLPKTNYVLKRLIASWLEENPNFVTDKALDEADSAAVLISPVSVISQASINRSMEVRHAISNIVSSEVLEEAESAVLCVERFWLEENVDVEIQHMLLKPPVINGLVEILINSVDLQVLRASIFLLSELGFKDAAVIQTLTRVESDVDCIVTLFKSGLMEAVVLMYRFGLSIQRLQEMDLAGSLLNVVKKKEDVNKMQLSPKSAAVILLRKILGRSKEGSLIAVAVLAENAIESILVSLKAKQVEERIAAVGILLRCIQEDGKCRNMIADKADLAPILGSFMEVSNDEQFEIIMFLSELVKLNRRTFNEQILQNIKDGGECSTMHSLLVYLQTAPRDQCPVVAGFLLQLDILVEPRKSSIYREEAMDVLLSCLGNSDFPTAQISAAETIMSLQGRFSTSGRPLTRYVLLERVGFAKGCMKPKRRDNNSSGPGDVELSIKAEERATDEWERKMAFVLASHDFGLLFEPLAKGLKSKYAALFSACFVSATWLSHMLKVLPDTGILDAARVCLLDHFVSIFITTTDIEEKALALLGMNSFVHQPEGLQYLSSNMKDIMRGLKELRRSTALAFEMLKVLCKGEESSAELWSHQELFLVDCSRNGEVLSIAYFKDKIISGHSDGTIKVWSVGGTNLHPLQETQEHSKGVTSLAIIESEEKLYSGSLDKTIKVWSLGSDVIQCIQVHDVKDQVHNLVVSKTIACFIPHGAGIRVYSWGGESKLLNSSKHVKRLNLVRGKLYCGCHDSSIQEVDLATGTVSYIHIGSRKLLGKPNIVQSLQIYDEQLFSASTTLDGAAVKIWSMSNNSVIATLSTAMDIRTMTVSSDLTYLGGRGGVVEIWGRDKLNKIDTLQTGRICKVACMTLNEREDVLVIGTSDGRIQAWGL